MYILHNNNTHCTVQYHTVLYTKIFSLNRQTIQFFWTKILFVFVRFQCLMTLTTRPLKRILLGVHRRRAVIKPLIFFIFTRDRDWCATMHWRFDKRSKFINAFTTYDLRYRSSSQQFFIRDIISIIYDDNNSHFWAVRKCINILFTCFDIKSHFTCLKHYQNCINLSRLTQSLCRFVKISHFHFQADMFSVSWASLFCLSFFLSGHDHLLESV